MDGMGHGVRAIWVGGGGSGGRVHHEIRQDLTGSSHESATAIRISQM
jgi:hypothetical protein